MKHNEMNKIIGGKRYATGFCKIIGYDGNPQTSVKSVYSQVI